MQKYLNGALVDLTPAEVAELAAAAPALSVVQTALCALVDATAETKRLKYITAGAGQMGVYLEKQSEAARLQTDPAPVPAPENYPLLAADIGVDAANILEAASNVRAQAAVWRTVAASIEHTRRGAKVAITAATTAADAQAVYDAVNWGGV